jgi:REP element-mobilizing transposase RayT
MARPLRIEYPGAVYHVTSRGNGRADIYLSNEDRKLFMEVLEHVVDRFGWICHAYCLMTNHYHLMIETPRGNLSQGMRQLNGVFTRRFNIRHGRVGHLFQGRYKAILVEKEPHLLSLCRYIVWNPVAAGMVSDVSEWCWSSYQTTAGLARKPMLLTIDWVLEQFGGNHDRYRQYISEAEITDSPLTDGVESNVLGSVQFRGSVQQHINADAENPRAQAFVVRKPLGELDSISVERGDECLSRAWLYHARDCCLCECSLLIG